MYVIVRQYWNTPIYTQQAIAVCVEILKRANQLPRRMEGRTSVQACPISVSPIFAFLFELSSNCGLKLSVVYNDAVGCQETATFQHFGLFTYLNYNMH